MDSQENWSIADEGKRTTTQVAIPATEEKEYFSHIPIDVAIEILLRLPVKSLLRFKAVCKSWLSLISDPLFKKSHVNLANKSNNVNYIHLSNDGRGKLYFHTNIRQRQHSVDFTSIVKSEPSEIKEGKAVCPLFLPIRRKNFVLGSCDGLLFVSQHFGESFLWNPSTGEKRTILQRRDYAYRTSSLYHVSGLGYDSSLHEYKAIIFCLDQEQKQSHMFICCSRSVGYRKGEDGDHDYDLAFKICHSNYSSRLGLTVGGAPHWIYASEIDSETVCRTIVYFDMVEEKFKNLPTPMMPSCWNDKYSLGMALFEGCLCIVEDIGVDKYIRTYNVWAMKEYGVKESWTKLFVIRLRSWSSMPLRFSKNGDELVLLLNSGDFMTYNLKTGKDTVTEECLSFNLDAAYVESLISP